MPPNTTIWEENLCENGRSISNIESMISFYGIKPYYMIVFTYIGGLDYRFQIYNPYALEIPYHL